MNLTDPADDRQAFLQHPKVRQTYSTLRVVWVAMMVSMATMSYVLFNAFKAQTRVTVPVLMAIGALAAVGSLFVPQLIAKRIRGTPGDPVEGRMPALMILYILRFAMTEMGLLLLLMGDASGDAMRACVYLGAALALMAIHFPR
jgi:hypothetical protein